MDEKTKAQNGYVALPRTRRLIGSGNLEPRSNLKALLLAMTLYLHPF